jgi:hypothetical protein
VKLRHERDVGEAIVRISNIAHQMSERLSRSPEFGRVILPHDTGNP